MPSPRPTQPPTMLTCQERRSELTKCALDDGREACFPDGVCNGCGFHAADVLRRFAESVAVSFAIGERARGRLMVWPSDAD